MSALTLIEIDTLSTREIPDAPGHHYRDRILLGVRIPRRTVTAPRPQLSQKPGKKLDAALCSGVIWPVVIISTESLEGMRSRSLIIASWCR